ncbi:MBL fold metallo-hydrolase [Candidatus Micrarchaeota archaeon CG10_big_fil_rev_8_21_14_0_10_45_29]|nr:MAG: MBL fold metallo-hydrolase [Candidatus Micrarchaeota archaeon CG10_big_fil_rev_8_21_14_0_10_45_29]
MKLIFLGTNGWYSTSTGNTVSALITAPERYIVLDAGDGIQHLDKYVKDNKPIDIFLSHFHLDHVIGLHIQPKFRFMKNKFRIFGQPGTKKWLNILVNNPFTASYALLKKQGFDVSIHELREGENKIDEYTVHTAPLVHADPCWGFRFEIMCEKEKKIISYCTDTGPCENIVKLSKNADALITECGLLPGEPIPVSWPHMNPEDGAKLAKEANVKKLIFTHFAPHKYLDVKMRENAQAEARKIFPNAFAATDGEEFEI